MTTMMAPYTSDYAGAMFHRPYHHGDLRAALLDGAERALAEQGPDALSLRELARRAGVSHAAPGRHFRGKNHLLDTLALTGFERLDTRLGEAVEEPGDPRSRLLALARGYVGFALDHPALLELMYARKHTPSRPEELTTAVGRLVETVLRPVTEGQEEGSIAPGDPGTIALTVAATLHGLTSYADADSLRELEGHLPAVVDLLLSGLLPR